MTHSAFSGFEHIASGSLAQVYAASSHIPDCMIFDRETGRVTDIDPRFPPKEDGPRPGRPKLGVTPREVTLLPRHWDWLATQPGGASVMLRRLVEEARKASADRPSPRAAMDAAYHFLTVMAGDRTGYEEAIRALYAKDRARFERASEHWPRSIRDHGAALAEPAFG